MKIFVRILIGIACVLVLGASAMYVRFYVMLPKYRKAPDVTIVSNADTIARGKYLANNVLACMGCHTEGKFDSPGDPIDESQLGAGRDFYIPDFPGHVRAQNLTPDKAHGLGDWTDGEILRAMREGVDKHNRALFPMMPYQTYGKNLSDEDAIAIIAYLRSLPANDHDPGKMVVNFPISMFIRAVPKPLKTPAGPAPADGLARGQWILQVASCGDCHTPMKRGKPIESKRYAGGNKFPVKGVGTIIAPNITSDGATGIGAYSDDDLLRVFNEGIGKAGRPLYVMPWSLYRGMTDADKRALILALRQIPAISNVVSPSKFDK
jgi:mono/diheme cytochrome c family protein